MLSIEDHEIVELYWKRSETAISETERKYSKYCYAVAHNILQNNEDSQECVNDTLERAWGAIPPARPSVLRTFLGKITRNLALNVLEKANAEKRGAGQTVLALSELEDCVASKGTVGEQFIEMEAITQIINNFLERLDATQRKVFVRRYWYTSSIDDIANDYKMTASSVKNILFRLRKKLKKELEKEGIIL